MSAITETLRPVGPDGSILDSTLPRCRAGSTHEAAPRNRSRDRARARRRRGGLVPFGQRRLSIRPEPLETLVEDGEGGPVVARVLVGIPGAEREGRSQDGMPLLLVRLRIENKSEAALTFDPARALLLGSDLARFGAARLEAPEPTEEPVRIEPGESRGMLLRFPFPRDGSLDAPLLTGVNLQFELGREAGDLEPQRLPRTERRRRRRRLLPGCGAQPVVGSIPARTSS